MSSQPQKSINNLNYLNYYYDDTDDEEELDDYDLNGSELYAARITKPPIIPSSSTENDKKILKVKNTKTNPIKIAKDSAKPTTTAAKTRSAIAKTSYTAYDENGMPSDLSSTVPMPSTDIIMTDAAPLAATTPSKSVSKPTTRTRTPIVLGYDIIEDVLSSKANINIGDLITASPFLKRQLLLGCRSKGKRTVTHRSDSSKTDLNFMEEPAEDSDPDTTAVYTQVAIGGLEVKATIDTGSCRSILSKELADKLSLTIDDSSNTVFMLGNGLKQPALGLIYEVPVNVNNKLTVPITMEVLPECPANLIIGTNWLNRAKAKINLESKSIKVQYKNRQAELPIFYFRKNKQGISKQPPLVVSSEQVDYAIEGDTKSRKSKKVSFDDDDEDDHPDSLERHYENDEILHDSDDSDLSSDEEDEINSMELFMMHTSSQDTASGNQAISLFTSEDHDDLYKVYSNETLTIGPRSVLCISLLNFECFKSKFSKFNKYHLHPSLVGSVNTQSALPILYIDDYSKPNDILLCLRNDTDVNTVVEPTFFLGEVETLNNSNVEECYIFKEDKLSQLADQYCSELFLGELSVTSGDKVASLIQDVPELDVGLQELIDITDTPQEIKSSFLKLLHLYQDIFDWYDNEMGYTTLSEHEIILKPGSVPKKARPYRLSPMESEALKEELDKFLKMGIIEECPYSDWSSPIILIKKKQNDKDEKPQWRLVVDYRYLNSCTVKQARTLPRIDDLIDELGKSNIFSAIDLRKGFHQLGLKENSRPLTCFTTKFGSFSYSRLAMGLCNAPIDFGNVIERCFQSMLHRNLVTYIDDIVAHNFGSLLDHLNVVHCMFECVRQAGLKLNPSKCKFFTDRLTFLGFVITGDGVEQNPALVEKVKNFPLPKTKKECMSFVSLSSYYRRFIFQFAKISRPLYEIVKGIDYPDKITWNDQAIEAFEKLKTSLVSAPVLMRADFDKPFYVLTDASIDGLGCVLSQLDDDNKEHPVMYASRSTTKGERNYGISKLEMAAVIFALKQFRPYLLGNSFQITIISDHACLNGLLNTKSPTGILARWLQYLAEYDYTIKYRPGKKNNAADFLSRLGY